MLDVLSDDYVRTARSKGMSECRVVLQHALKNALIPILTVLGLTAALLISGAVVTETVFGLPGIGNLVVSAVLRRDYPVIQGALLVIAALYVLINFADRHALPRSSIRGCATDGRRRSGSSRASAAFVSRLADAQDRDGRPRRSSLIIAALAILAPLIAPYSPSRLSIVNRLQAAERHVLVRHRRVRPRRVSAGRSMPDGCRCSSASPSSIVSPRSSG